MEIVLIREPGVSEALARKVVARRHTGSASWTWPSRLGWRRPSTGPAPSTSSARPSSTRETAADTLGAVVKERDDLELVRDNLEEITSGA